ncbi:MAG: hypothetical protein PHF53_05970 [Bacteroidales bacterium]|nr:hypothetical protein [Bacteroidales bacterium]
MRNHFYKLIPSCYGQNPSYFEQEESSGKSNWMLMASPLMIVVLNLNELHRSYGLRQTGSRRHW